MRRRDFLTISAGGAGSLLFPGRMQAASGEIHRQASRPLRILVLGGTNFVGPAIVEVALERGHAVTLFNRGITNPWLSTHLERLVGDRYPNRGPGLAPLEGGRRWDAVIDTWQESPLAVDLTARLLRDRSDRYVYVSSIAVYQGRNYRKASFDERAELPPAKMPATFDAELAYPVRKQLGEEAAASKFPGRHTILRAYGIAGVDALGRIPAPSSGYWAMRLRQGGEVLAPGDGEDVTQWTDVRDLAELTIHAIEEGLSGVYNVSRRATFRQFLADLSRIAPSAPEMRLTWVPAPFLFERGLRSFVDVPGWVWRKEEERGFYHASTEKAEAAGLRHRSAAQSMRPMVDAFLRYHADVDFTAADSGVAISHREQEILAAWHA